jgi:hypothetical protein
MSKLNPQKASAYVGPGVLRKGGKITPVPNGPLIKKKGPFKGSGLKSGGTIKKAQNGTSEYSDPKPLFDKIKRTKDSIDNARIKLEEKKFKSKMEYLNGKLKNEQSMMNTKKVKKAKAGAMIKRAQNGDTTTVKKPKVDGFFKNIDKKLIKKSDTTEFYKGRKSKIMDDGFFKGPKVKSTGLKNGGLIKRADGSMSRRGLWDNLRSKAAQNKKTGAKPKSPTKAMLTQEKKIKAKGK